MCQNALSPLLPFGVLKGRTLDTLCGATRLRRRGAGQPSDWTLLQVGDDPPPQSPHATLCAPSSAGALTLSSHCCFIRSPK